MISLFLSELLKLADNIAYGGYIQKPRDKQHLWFSVFPENTTASVPLRQREDKAHLNTQIGDKVLTDLALLPIYGITVLKNDIRITSVSSAGRVPR